MRSISLWNIVGSPEMNLIVVATSSKALLLCLSSMCWDTFWSSLGRPGK